MSEPLTDSPDSSMSPRFKCAVTVLAFILSIFTCHVRYDVSIRRQGLQSERTILSRSNDGTLEAYSIPRDSTGSLHGAKVSEGDVDVAIFTIRKERAKLLPRTYYCPKWNRSITYRNARFNVSACERADAILFTSGKDFNRLVYWAELQAQRTNHQIWVLSSPESAVNTLPMFPPIDMRTVKFNLSSTFDIESDIPIPYGEYTPFRERITIPFRSKFLNETSEFAVWVASHCPLRTWNRTGIVHHLSKYIPIDVYGACGNLTCHPKDRKCNLFRSYKFYLSLENSCCVNYITEKLWAPLMNYEAIPVVLGARREDYQRIAPPNSFIHIDDFASIEDLASYLVRVATNATLYRSYFEWRNSGYVRYQKLYQSIWESEQHSCKLLEYVKGVRPLQREGFDPYGPEWLSGCSKCGTQSWLDKYYLHPFQPLYDRI